MSAGKRPLPPSALRLLRSLGALLFWLLIWQLAAMRVGKPLILPEPAAALSALLQSAREADFWLSAVWSVLRILAGFAVGTLTGILLAAATSASRICDTLLSPMIRVFRATPVSSFIILALLWLRTTVLPGFIAALMVLPVVWENVSQGIAKTDPLLLEMGQVYGLSRAKLLRLIYVPSLLPWIRSACTTGLGLAWKSGVAAEVLCQPRSAIGTQLYFSKIYLETDRLFAWTAVVIFLSVVLEHLLRRFLRRGHPGVRNDET